jgi:Ubiquitin carboxyl-terminal hydrolase/Zn-finger in ubiquitin-hydrolases and other protein
MKKDSNEKRIERFLLEQQFPDARVASGGIVPSTSSDGIAITPVDQVTQITLETCRCVHLQEFLPHLLDLEMCRAVNHPRGWVIANPVHSMHVTSQLEDDVPAMGHERHHHYQAPVFYGEEQQRTMTLKTSGIPEYWCPLDGYSAFIHCQDNTPQTTNVLSSTMSLASSALTSIRTDHSAAGIVGTSALAAGASKTDDSDTATDTVRHNASSTADPSTCDQPTGGDDDPNDVKQEISTSQHMKSSESLMILDKAEPNMEETMGEPSTVEMSMQTEVNKVAAHSIDSSLPSSEVDMDNPNGPAPVLSSSDTNSSSVPVHSPPIMSSPLVVTTQEIPYELSEAKYNQLRMEEDRIRLIRRSLASYRMFPTKKVDSKNRVDPKKKRKKDDTYKAPGIPGWHDVNLNELTNVQEDDWLEARDASKFKVDRWMENFRSCRETFWVEHHRQISPSAVPKESAFYLPQDQQISSAFRCCEICLMGTHGDKDWDGSSQRKARKPRRRFTGDDVMQCLECNFVGCSPQSICADSKQHILQHLLISGHKFAVSCGKRGQLFCFCCGDVVYHEVFEQEKARIDYGMTLPSMAWKPHQLYRSFDPFHFMKTHDHGIVWRGLVATYPQLVPPEHVRATEATRRRQALFNGEIHEKWLIPSPAALTFAAMQSLREKPDRHRIKSPVGMYNLGNTCYKSSVLQCLVHCLPLQQFFLKNNGHNRHACKLYRQWDFAVRKVKRGLEESICLACELDRLYLTYYGSTIGVDVHGAVDEVCNSDNQCSEMIQPVGKGDPLVISEMLTASWKSGGMNSVASYKQHDSHEFLNSFLELVGKQTQQHWSRVDAAINVVKTNNAVLQSPGESKQGETSDSLELRNFP